MTKRRGSFREKNKPLISLKNLSDQGTIVIPRVEYKPADPIPSTWIMIKPGDMLISKSGTLRLVLRKNWQEGQVESLRLTCEQQSDKLEASLEVEKMEIDSSNFEHLTSVLRPIFSTDISPHEYRPEFFTRSVRYNILTFLGFGSAGGAIYEKLPSAKSRRRPSEIRLTFMMDGRSNLINDLLDEADYQTTLSDGRLTTLQIEIVWSCQPADRTYRIVEFSYPPGCAATTLETVTLACEIANVFSMTEHVSVPAD